MIDADATLRDAVSGFMAANGPAAGAAFDQKYWYLGSGLLHIRVPNFAWRKRALARHDIHHLLTGYPCTPAGEMQLAAWEFAAGRFPHPGATAFCLPLVGLGALLLPRRMFAAFVRGRRSTSLYATTLSEALLASPVADLRDRLAPPGPTVATIQDALAYLRLVGWSLALMLVPVLLPVLALAVIGWR